VPDPAPEKTAYADGNDVETAKGFFLPSHYQKITCRVHDVCQFHVGYRYDGVNEGSLLPRPYLHENYGASLACHDVDLPRWAQEISLKDAVTAKQKVEDCGALAAFAGENVGGFFAE
jgi:hypothetical protein